MAGFTQGGDGTVPYCPGADVQKVDAQENQGDNLACIENKFVGMFIHFAGRGRLIMELVANGRAMTSRILGITKTC
jgi:hypothetical protein